MYINEIEKYRSEGSTDEWFISKLLAKCASELSAEQAFQEISSLVEVLLREKEWDTFLNHCQYILRLARVANTTEIPQNMEENISAIKSKVLGLDLGKHNEVQDLYAWFRI